MPAKGYGIGEFKNDMQCHLHRNQGRVLYQASSLLLLPRSLTFSPCPSQSGMQPSSKRQNGIIQLTAKRAANQTQFELLLKVKQADNRDFAFLSPGNDLHSYYSWLKGRGGAIIRERSASEPSSSSSERKGGLGGLLAGYGSSSSSCSSDEESAADGLPKQKAEMDESLEDKRAKRLKRAQELKAHFESKLAK